MRAAVVRRFGAPLVIEEAVNESIDEVLHGKARARIVLQP